MSATDTNASDHARRALEEVCARADLVAARELYGSARAMSPAGCRTTSEGAPDRRRSGNRPVHARHRARVRLGEPVHAAEAIGAQARMMRDLLRRFASVPLALAAYNAGPAQVAACMCVPPIPETRGYVARILGLLGGTGDAPPNATLAVRLVR
jgi:hypothetical protein